MPPNFDAQNRAFQPIAIHKYISSDMLGGRSGGGG